MIDKCPICGALIEATVRAYTTGVILTDDLLVEHLGYSLMDDEDPLIYCENDHSLEEMEEFLSDRLPACAKPQAVDQQAD